MDIFIGWFLASKIDFESTILALFDGSTDNRLWNFTNGLILMLLVYQYEQKGRSKYCSIRDAGIGQTGQLLGCSRFSK